METELARDRDPGNCPICANSKGNSVLHAREMMFGSGEQFRYLVCSRCGCLSLLNSPRDFSQYYPGNYYSLETQAGFGRVLREIGYGLLFRSPIPRTSLAPLISFLSGTLLAMPLIVRESVRRIPRRPAEIRVLDVGCGNGKLLRALRSAGFRNLLGIDPYLPRSIRPLDEVRLEKGTLAGLRGRFDFIMLHHTLEHMPQPRTVMTELRRLLVDDGILLVRIPLADSWAFRTYGENWVQLDAPRHLHVFTGVGMRLLARESGFELLETLHDSTEFQFWGSERYVRGLGLASPGPHAETIQRATRRITDQLRTRATRLNAMGQGDQAAFVFRPVYAP